MAGGVGLWNSDQLDFRVGRKRAPLAERQRDGDDAGKAQPPAGRDRSPLRIHQKGAVLVDATGRNLADDLRRAGRKTDQVAIAAKENLGNTGAAGKLRVLGQV